MINNKQLSSFHKAIWLGIALLGVLMEAGALYYQYVLDYGPCSLCVQMRAVVFLIILVSLFALFLNNYFLIKLFALLQLCLVLSFGYISYQLLGIERGWFDGNCTFAAPFPDWAPLHQWAPILFEPWELCGYTPEMIGKITMAEILGALTVLLLAMTLALLFKAPASRDRFL